jgi:phosphoglycerate dehydrogenase-like enzyme
MKSRFGFTLALVCFVSLPVRAHAEETAAQVAAALGLKESPAPVREMKGWTPPHKIVVVVDTPQRLAWLQEAVKGITIAAVTTPKDAFAQIPDADAYLGFCQTQLLVAGKNLKWIHSRQAGVEECLTPKVREGGVLITNVQRLNGPNVSEHAMALLLTLTRQINVALANQEDGRWDAQNMQNVTDLDGKTMLITGLGGIGTDIAKRANAFGMRVIATRATHKDGPPFVAHVGLPKELPTMIGEADVVVNATPLTTETRHMFDAAMFARMKPTAYFINVGRGESVVTDDLVAALKDGKITGAGLDVTDPDPLPKGHPLWDVPNVVITPHTAATSELKEERGWILMRENMRRYVAGEKMYSVVDVKRGY